EDSSCCGLQCTCMSVGIGKIFTMEDNSGSIATRCHNFDQWGMGRHDNCGRNSERLGGNSDGLGVIAHGGGNDAMRPLLCTQPGNLVGSTTHFEGACALQILRLEVYIGSRHSAEGTRMQQRRYM